MSSDPFAMTPLTLTGGSQNHNLSGCRWSPPWKLGWFEHMPETEVYTHCPFCPRSGFQSGHSMDLVLRWSVDQRAVPLDRRKESKGANDWTLSTPGALVSPGVGNHSSFLQAKHMKIKSYGLGPIHHARARCLCLSVCLSVRLSVSCLSGTASLCRHILTLVSCTYGVMPLAGSGWVPIIRIWGIDRPSQVGFSSSVTLESHVRCTLSLLGCARLAGGSPFVVSVNVEPRPWFCPVSLSRIVPGLKKFWMAPADHERTVCKKIMR